MTVRTYAFLLATLSSLCAGFGQYQHWAGQVGAYEMGGEAQFAALSDGLMPAMPTLGDADTAYHVIQLAATPTERILDELRAAGATLHDYVPHNAYLARIAEGRMADVLAVPGVRSVHPFVPALRVLPSLANRLSAPTRDNPALTGDTIPVGIELFTDAPVAEIERMLTLRGAAVHSSQVAGGSVMMYADMPAAAVSDLVMSEGVKWVAPTAPPTLLNNVARILVGADPAGLRYAPGQYLFGAGEVVAVLDTGLDTGDVGTIHPDLAGRIVEAEGWGTQGFWSDVSGHGTHVAGTIAGNGSLSGSNPGGHTYAGSYAGIAPEATLAIHSLSDESGSLIGADSFYDIMAAAYLQGARIANNSWGAETYGIYDYWARLVDTYAVTHPDVLLVFAAGNSGADRNYDGVIDSGSIGSPASAKNVLAVGASENNESGRWGTARIGWTYSVFGYLSNPIGGDRIADNPSGIAAFSSRGPTRDNRVKPEIVAPGTAIISTRSSIETASYHKAVNDDYAILSGTSMACPIVTGAAAVVRQYLGAQLGITDPPAALLKAVLMASSRDLSPGQYGTGTKREVQPAPNNVEGVGRVDVAAATGPAVRVLAEDETIGARQFTDYLVNVPGGKPEMRVVIAWTDPLGASNTNFQLVNNIDLTVYDPAGRRYIATSKYDNFETLYWQNPMPGTWRFRVVGTRVNTGAQDYSMVLFWRW